MKLNLEGHNVVVTGGSRGIGLGIAAGFAAEGCNISICARGQESLDAARADLEALGAKVHTAICDVADGKALEAYIDAAAAELGGINVLVNNPSGFGTGDSDEAWQKGMDVDVMALVRATRQATKHMEKAGGGSVVHIASISGLASSTRNPAYGAVKAAVIQYTTSQASLLAEKNIRVNCIAPGSIEFPGGLWDMAKKNAPDLYGSIKASIPFDRLGTPEEIANVAVFLASDAGRWVTGQTVAVDGGQLLR